MGGSLLHVGHDAAMLAMTMPHAGSSHSPHHHAALPEPVICGAHNPPTDHTQMQDMPQAHARPMDHAHMQGMPQAHAGLKDHAHMQGAPQTSAPPMDHAHMHGGSSWLMQASAATSAAVAIGSAMHASTMLQSSDRRTRLEGANHLLMSASCASMAAAMGLPGAGLGPLTSTLMAAHGLGEVALGTTRLIRGLQTDCRHDQVSGLLQTLHGGCLAAAQAFPGAAVPLYLGMAASTATQRLLTLTP